MTQIIFVQVTEFCQMIQSNVITVVRVQLTFDGGTFTTWVLGWHQLKGRISDAAQLDHQDLQHVAADYIISFFLPVQFAEK